MNERTETIAKMATRIYCTLLKDRLVREWEDLSTQNDDDHDLMAAAVRDAEAIMARAEGRVQ